VPIVAQQSDIEFAASVLREARPAPDGSLEGVNRHYEWQSIVRTFERQFAARHPRSFDANIFRRLAGYPRPTN
jgi:hypothetical protein